MEPEGAQTRRHAQPEGHADSEGGSTPKDDEGTRTRKGRAEPEGSEGHAGRPKGRQRARELIVPRTRGLAGRAQPEDNAKPSAPEVGPNSRDHPNAEHRAQPSSRSGCRSRITRGPRRSKSRRPEFTSSPSRSTRPTHRNAARAGVAMRTEQARVRTRACCSAWPGPTGERRSSKL